MESDATAEGIEAFRSGFIRLKSGIDVLRSIDQKFQRYAATDFNLIRVFGLEYREAAHSRFLAELLNPEGSHGQGRVLLDAFLEQLARRDPKLPTIVECRALRWTVEREVCTPEGRLDIVLTATSNGAGDGAIVVIENKIDAAEQCDQLSRYSQWRGRQPRRSSLVYLTLHGQEATSAKEGKDYVRLSYRDDITAWLDAILPRIGAPVVQTAVRQYREILETLTGGRNVNRSIRDGAIRDFLRQPEHFSTAWEIADQMEQVKEEMVSEFWRDLESRIREYVDQVEVKWIVKPAGQALLVYPNSGTEGQYLRIVAGEEDKEIFFGILWPGGAKARPGKPSKEQLNLPGAKEDWKSNDNWVAWKSERPSWRKRKSMIRDGMSTLPELAKELAEGVKELIERNKTFIEDEDRRLASEAALGQADSSSLRPEPPTGDPILGLE